VSWKSESIILLSKLLRPGPRAGCAAAVLSGLLKAAGPRRTVAAKNLSFILPDAPPKEIKRLVNETYEHMIWIGIELIMLQSDPRQVLEWVEPENEDILENLVGRGAVLVSCHVGNWEVTGAWLAQRGYCVTTIIREPDNSEDRSLMVSMTERLGARVLSRKKPLTSAISILKRGEFLGILSDQHGGHEGVIAPFFGVDTPTPQGPAYFAYLTGRPIVPVFSRRVSPCRHKISIAPPIEWKKLSTRDETILDITRRVNASLERMILEAPGQWLAQHRRFRENHLYS